MDYEHAIILVKKGIPVYASSSHDFGAWGNCRLLKITQTADFDPVEDMMDCYYRYPACYEGYLSREDAVKRFGEPVLERADKRYKYLHQA
jgi:hypothetical protein